MTEQPYRPGEVLRIVHEDIRAVRTAYDPDLGLVVVAKKRMKNGVMRKGPVFPEAPGTTVTRVSPAEGPPRPGQL